MPQQTLIWIHGWNNALIPACDPMTFITTYKKLDYRFYFSC
jgi:hypothetical protein